MKNILCATDFSDFSNHTIPYGVALAKEFDAKLYVCHVI
ncbi:MAG: universal stress protein, partial [Desulfobacterales bacterium]